MNRLNRPVQVSGNISQGRMPDLTLEPSTAFMHRKKGIRFSRVTATSNGQEARYDLNSCQQTNDTVFVLSEGGMVGVERSYRWDPRTADVAEIAQRATCVPKLIR